MWTMLVGLDFNHSVRHQLDESGHQCFHCLYGFKEFDPYREVLATAAGSALGMEAMMRSKSRESRAARLLQRSHWKTGRRQSPGEDSPPRKQRLRSSELRPFGPVQV